MYKPKYIYKAISYSNLREIDNKNISKCKIILDSPTGKLVSGTFYGHYVNADEHDAPKINQKIIQVSGSYDICDNLIKLTKLIISIITLGCL